MSLSDEQQIRDVIGTWMKASREGDLATVMNLMTQDVVFLTPGNAPMRREDFKGQSKEMAPRVQIDGDFKVQEITVTGDLAVCWNYLEITVTPLDGGAAVKRAGNVLSVFRRENDGQWRIWRDANMLGLSS